MALRRWTDSKAEICLDIETRPALLRILLKTRNDPEGALSWMEHHSKIVDPSHIIICDNSSDDDRARIVYEEIESRGSIVFSFDGFHNFIHQPKAFPRLQGALANSSEYYIILDSDERIVLIDESAATYSIDIVSYLKDEEIGSALPTVWMVNAHRSESIFEGITQQGLLWGLKWGKPIINPRAGLGGTLLHNIEVKPSAYSRRLKPRIAALHLMNLDPVSRTKVNLQKLISRGVVSAEATAAEVASMDESVLEDGTARRFIREIRDLQNPPERVDDLRPGAVKFDGGTLTYYSAAERSALMRLIAGGAIVEEAFPVAE